MCFSVKSRCFDHNGLENTVPVSQVFLKDNEYSLELDGENCKMYGEGLQDPM